MVNPPKFQCVTCGFLCETEEIGNKHKLHVGETRNGVHIIEPFLSLALKTIDMEKGLFFYLLFMFRLKLM